MGSLGVPEMMLIFILALVLFGPKKLPEIGRTLGKAITEFRKASTELKATFEREMQTLEQETQSIKEVTNQYQYDTYNYDYSSYEPQDANYGETNDSTAASPSTESASAPQGAELPSAETPEGVVAYGSEPHADSQPLEGSGPSEEREPVGSEAASSPAEHNT
ncbi:MAG: TatA/E family twin arginine-targeting protein translocase [Acidobacteriia bacterium]|nr:TatA/E family twin arginine-targeting protein translocase [Terriglobia bacterium]